jgi:hypothetical protein
MLKIRGKKHGFILKYPNVQASAATENKHTYLGQLCYIDLDVGSTLGGFLTCSRCLGMNYLHTGRAAR